MDATAKDRRDTLVRLVGWPALAMAGTTGGGPALGGPGDLDPAFGEVGRAVGLPDGELWSLEVHDDESVQFGGGETEYCGYYSYDCGVFDTLGRLDALGGADTVFAAGNLERTYVYDTALLEDGRLVGTGFSRSTSGRDRLTVFRLLPDGALDTTFGLTGQVMLAGGTGLDTGYSVLVENDGRIVVGGIRQNSLMVVRFLANGTLDATFGTGGEFRLTTPQVSGSTRLASAPGGGYRVLANVATDAGPRCSIVGLTSNGTQDTTFGDGGVLPAPAGTPGPTYCNTFAVLPGGVMLVAGNAAPGGYVARILADGAVDPTFDPAPVADRLDDVSALAVGATGKLFVAGPGSGVAGTTIVRLLASGLLDEAFGQGGSM
ncbi:MAG TPA: hypothetical protein VFP48_03625, partial [Steroidobacteraceae bacterium]|nr:hypothetical protein [Steroidobacteraceae bacterium]